MARKPKWDYCEWCMDKVYPPEKVCAKHKPDWEEFQAQMQPVRDKARAALSDHYAATRAEREDLRQRIKDCRTALSHAERNWEEYENRITKILGEALDVDDIALGTWECEYSPTNFCFYDHGKDWIHDHCLMCGQPDERK